MPLPVTVPNTFANATSSIPLSQLDANFSTLANAVNDINSGATTLVNLKASNATITGGTISNVTLDNVTVQTESFDNVTMSNVTITSGNATFTNVTCTLITNGSGTSAAPSITFTGDPNTGIFSPAADTIAFAEGGVEAMRIDSSGNMLVGTTTTGSTGISLSSSYNVGWGQSAGESVPNIFRQTSSAATVIANGYRYSATANGFASSFSSSFAKTAIALNEGTIRLYTDTATTTAAGTDVTPTERMRIDSSGNMSVGGTASRGTTAGSAAIQLFNGTAPVGTLTNGVSLYSASGDLRFMDAAGNAYQVGFRNIPQSGTDKTTSYTLATTDVGEFVGVGTGGSITIPNSTFATGDVVSIFNNTSGNITITCSITTAYIAGTDSDKASVTLATRGVATVLFISSTVCVITGNVS